jgi:hypothetical protein
MVYSDSSRSCTRFGAQGLIRLGSMIYSNKVYVVYVKHKLGFKNNVYSDPIKSVVHSELDTMCTQTPIGAQGCNQTRIQAPSVLGLDQQGIQIKASNCDKNVTRTLYSKRLNLRLATDATEAAENSTSPN